MTFFSDLPGVSDTDETRTPLLLVDTAGCDMTEAEVDFYSAVIGWIFYVMQRSASVGRKRLEGERRRSEDSVQASGVLDRSWSRSRRYRCDLALQPSGCQY